MGAMKHLKDAHQRLLTGDSAGAFEILEHLLAFAPRNPEALKLKAHILDAWGRFDESLVILQQLAGNALPNSEDAEGLLYRLKEEKESMIYSQLTQEGRWYFPFVPGQMFVSMLGLLGSIFFFVSAPNYLGQPGGSLPLVINFILLILLPSLLLLTINFKGLKKILVGVRGVQMYYGFQKVEYGWNDMGHAVIEYDPNLTKNHLFLIVYSKSTREKLFSLDISEKSSVIKARRHFVRLLLSYFESVSYVATGRQEDTYQAAA